MSSKSHSKIVLLVSIHQSFIKTKDILISKSCGDSMNPETPRKEEIQEGKQLGIEASNRKMMGWRKKSLRQAYRRARI